MLSKEKLCDFKPSHVVRNTSETSENDCSCSPALVAEQCHCLTMVTPGLRNSLIHPRHQISLVAYIRVIDYEKDARRQLELIESYCAEHGFRIVRTFEDVGKPSCGLAEALETLPQTDGLIAVDLNRFVEHPDNRLRDLRPFIHHFFCHPNKHLITIEEGIDTGSPEGQVSAIELINELKDLI